MGAPKDLLAEWQEARYVAFVNFLRKKGLYDAWKEFKSGKGRQDECDLMLVYLAKVMMENGQSGMA